MRLLVSVATAAEASAALAGGADVIDAKDPLAGALGPVTADVLHAIHAVVGGARPLTAALGDANDETAIERVARTYAAAGAAMVKAGFRGIASTNRITSLIVAAVRGARAEGARVVAVAYADAARASTRPAAALVELAARAGAEGLLLDTADKEGPGLRGLISADALAAFVADAHRAGLFVALAGKLSVDDLSFVCDVGADIAGVRGAACEGGRTGCVTANQVRALCAALRNRQPEVGLESL
jgi:(5-formylfuran-3-yl)methyl phosphate synthase